MATKQKAPEYELQFEHEDYEKLQILPWFNYVINLPQQPIPSNADRVQIKTERLIVRPLLSSDLEAFHSLRSIAAMQIHSTTRGRTDRDLAESQKHLENFDSGDQNHWYFGAFLQSTGELIGEGGLPDLDGWRSGRPEAEFLIKPDYWRQGYGTELWKAVMDSYWALPREKRRHQLLPAFVSAETEPGDEVVDGVGFVWEESNIAAKNFFGKMLEQTNVVAVGSFEDYDRREGRDRHLLRWDGSLTGNPRKE